MSAWSLYPETYRSDEVKKVCTAVQSGECSAVIGLSGAGKSNMIGFIANRVVLPGVRFVLVDFNRLRHSGLEDVLILIRTEIDHALPGESGNAWGALDAAISGELQNFTRLCLLIDRFDALEVGNSAAIYSNLRALRDAYKYQLVYVTAARHPLPGLTELSELFFAHTFWLGPLLKADAIWSIERYAARIGATWNADETERIFLISGGYPAFLRAVSEAYARGVELTLEAMLVQPEVQRRIDEFWAARPGIDELRQSGLLGLPLLEKGVESVAVHSLDVAQLTAKEYLLWQYFLAHPGEVCAKDDLVKAVWPEDKVYLEGVRDDSLAQLVRRLRKKIELTPSAPVLIHTFPGRGYQYNPPEK